MQRFRFPAILTLATLLVGLSASAASIPASGPDEKPDRRARYIAYARASADWAWAHYDEIVA